MMHLHAITRRERNAATAAASEVLSRHGWILDVVLYSNKMACFQVVTTLDDVAGLHEALSAEGLQLSEDGVRELAMLATEAQSATPAERTRERFGTVEVSFLAPEADLRRVVPMVPG